MAAAARWVVWQEEGWFEFHIANVTTELVPRKSAFGLRVCQLIAPEIT